MIEPNERLLQIIRALPRCQLDPYQARAETPDALNLDKPVDGPDLIDSDFLLPWLSRTNIPFACGIEKLKTIIGSRH